ncbi:hypothetical protein [Brevibacterium sediminis]
MPLRPVPWAIGNGAENSVELARAGIYSATSGATGITEPGDFIVKALPTPGAAVRVYKGGGVIKSTYPGVFGQSYAVQEQSYTDVPVAATGSSGGATKYVYVLIKDTQYSGQNPPSVEDGPYNDYAVTTTLPTNQPYLLLAKINQPASRADIQPGMIVDMRTIANPRKDHSIFARPRIREDDGTQMSLKGRYLNGSKTYWGELFPGGLGVPNQATFFVPEWATIMVLDARWLGIRVNGGQNSWGRYWIEYGDEGRDHGWDQGRQYEFATQQFGFDTVGTGTRYTTEWSLMDVVAVPKKLRGKDVTFAFKAGLHPDASTDGIFMDANGGLAIRADYAQQREDPDTI